MADLGFALAEMRRVLRPGGRVAICAWLAGEHVTGWQQRFLLDPTIRDGRLVTLTSPSQYRGLLEEAGFAGVTFDDLTAAVSRTWTVCARRLLRRLMSDSRYMRYLLSSGGGESRFLPAVLRMIAAYACGAMRYGLFAGQLAR
jgi:tocopherol O-methyltransferase